MIRRRFNDDAQSFEEAWNGRTPQDESIAELVRFAERLCESAAVEPSAEFRSDLRGQLMTEATTVLVPMPGAARPAAESTARASRRGRRRLAVLAATLVASAGGVGIVASSASALPGDMLYPVKRSVESVELTLHRSDSNRGAFQLAQATERLAEARQLSAADASPQLISEALDSFSESATSGSSRLFSDFTSSGSEKSVRKVNDFAEDANANLTALSDQLPAEVAPALTEATKAVSNLVNEATTLCVSCVSSDVQSLVNSVTNLAKEKPKTSTPASAKDKGKPTSPMSNAPKPAGNTPTKAPSSKPSTAPPTTPAPAPTTKAPSLTDVTDPLLGGLLGDENQEGLVPGLLNGLLGGGKK